MWRYFRRDTSWGELKKTGLSQSAMPPSPQLENAKSTVRS